MYIVPVTVRFKHKLNCNYFEGKSGKLNNKYILPIYRMSHTEKINLLLYI